MKRREVCSAVAEPAAASARFFAWDGPRSARVARLFRSLLPVMLFAGLGFATEECAAKGARISSGGSKVSRPSTSTAKDAGKAATKEIKVDVKLPSGSNTTPSGAQAGAAGAAGAAAAGAMGAAPAQAVTAPKKPQETPEEARQKMEAYEAKLQEQERLKAEQRAREDELIAKTRREREKAAEEERRVQEARRQSVSKVMGTSRPTCVYKPVMTDDDLAACR